MKEIWSIIPNGLHTHTDAQTKAISRNQPTRAWFKNLTRKVGITAKSNNYLAKK